VAQYYVPIEKRLQEIAEADHGRKRKSVVVFGAGIAGLVTAYELRKLGHRVEILEGSERIGGRIYTHYFGDGQYGELGAMRIPDSQDYTFYYIKKFGLPVGRFYNSNPRAFYNARGVVTRIEDAPKTLFPLFDLSAEDRALADDGGVGAVVQRYLDMLVNSLSDDAVRSLFDLDDRHPNEILARKEIDAQSYLEYLVDNVDTKDAIDMFGILQSLEEIWETSLTIRVRGAAHGQGGNLYEIVGGASLLPEAVGKQVADSVRFGQEICAINAATNPATFTVRDLKTNKVSTRQSDAIVCTIPFSVLRCIELRGLSQGKLSSIRTLNYASSSKVLLHCSDRFWQRPPYDIFGGSSISQDICRQTYYPNDQHPSYQTPWPKSSERRDIHAFILHREDEALRKHAAGAAPSPGVLLANYAWGMEARRIGALSLDARLEVMTNAVSAFHPEIAKYVDGGTSIFWDEHRWSKGAYAHPMPYGLEMDFPAALRPEGAVYFAGEHLSAEPGWIQGAIYSALATVLDLVKGFEKE
jgi:monoamine oxidase